MEQTELEKQAKIRREKYLAIKEEIKAQPAIKSWTQVSPHTGLAGYIFLFTLWLVFMIPAALVEAISFWWMAPFMALVLGIAGGSIFLIGTKYHYHITEEGFYADYQRDFPEWSLKIVRGIGVFGVVVCCVLAFFYGPALFIGAGASALGAFALVNYKEPLYSSAGIWSEVEYVFVFRKGRLVRLKGDKNLELPSVRFDLYLGEENFDFQVGELMEILPSDVKVIEVQKRNDMFINPSSNSA